jgi:16S rRNA (guanine966-N2)-methyltransferase
MLRIVGGSAKGRRLVAPPDGTRPTSERAREALFNTLATMLDLDGARVLDLYAGTGAVGLEALSRGAAEAVLVEQGRAALTALRRNVETIGLPGARILGKPVAAFLAAGTDNPFHLVFADPPYDLADEHVQAVLAALVDGGWLAADACVVVERSARGGSPAALAGSLLTTVSERRYGDALLWYGRRR